MIYFFTSWHMELPQPGSNPCPLHWKHRVLTTGSPRKAPLYMHFKLLSWIYLQHFISTLLMDKQGAVALVLRPVCLSHITPFVEFQGCPLREGALQGSSYGSLHMVLMICSLVSWLYVFCSNHSEVIRLKN